MMTKNSYDPGQAARKIEDFLKILSTTGGLNLKSNILACNGQVQSNSSGPAGEVYACFNRTLRYQSPGHRRA